MQLKADQIFVSFLSFGRFMDDIRPLSCQIKWFRKRLELFTGWLPDKWEKNYNIVGDEGNNLYFYGCVYLWKNHQYASIFQHSQQPWWRGIPCQSYCKFFQRFKNPPLINTSIYFYVCLKQLWSLFIIVGTALNMTEWARKL